jgi:hypothetical protein
VDDGLLAPAPRRGDAHVAAASVPVVRPEWLGPLAHAAVLAHAFFLSVSLAGVQIAIGVAIGALALAAASGHARRRSPLDLAVLIAVAASLLAVAQTSLRGFAPPDLETATRWKPVLSPLVLLAALSLPAPGEREGAVRRRAVAAVLAWGAGAALASAVGYGQALMGVDLYHLAWRDREILAPVPRWPGHYAATGFFPFYPQFAHALTPPIALAAALVLGAPLAPRRRALLGAAAALAAAAVALTASRAAFAGLVVEALVLLLLGGGRAVRRGLPLLAGAVLAAALLHPGLRARLASLDAPRENMNRQILVRVCAAVAKDHPLGVGLGNFTRVSGPYFDAIGEGYPIRTGCHLSPLELLVEGGPLLPLAWAVTTALVIRALLRARRSADALGRAAAAGGLAGLAGLLVNALFHDVHLESYATWPMGFTIGIAMALALGGAGLTAPPAPASAAPPAGTAPARRAASPPRPARARPAAPGGSGRRWARGAAGRPGGDGRPGR